MAMDPVSTIGSSAVQQAQVRVERNARPEPPPPPPPPPPQTQRAEEPQRPQPVVNLQGQKTGTIINTSA